MSITPKRQVLLLVSLGIALAGVVIGALILFTPKPDLAAAYTVVEVKRETQTVTLPLSGVIAPRTRANVSFTVGGTVTSVPAKVGEKVAKGDTLATIDSTDLKAAVALAEAQASAARAQLNTVKSTSGVRKAQIDAAAAQVSAAEASLSSARDRLAGAVLTSPITGTIAQVNLEVGDQAGGAGAPVGAGPIDPSSIDIGALTGGLGAPSGGGSPQAQVVVMGDDGWKLDAQVGTADLPALRPGQSAVVTPVGTTQRLKGKVDSVGIAATGTGASASFPVVVTIESAPGQLYAGSSADAVVTIDTIEAVIAVPVSAVTTQDDKSTVLVDAGGAATPTPVTIGRRFDNQLEITKGLAPGAKIRVPRSQVITKPVNPWQPPHDTGSSPEPRR